MAILDPVQRELRESRDELIRKRIREGMPLALISRRTGVHQNMIGRIKAVMVEESREIVALEAKGKGGRKMDKFAAAHSMVDQVKGGMETHQADEIRAKLHAVLDVLQKDGQVQAAAQGKGK